MSPRSIANLCGFAIGRAPGLEAGELRAPRSGEELLHDLLSPLKHRSVSIDTSCAQRSGQSGAEQFRRCLVDSAAFLSRARLDVFNKVLRKIKCGNHAGKSAGTRSISSNWRPVQRSPGALPLRKSFMDVPRARRRALQT